MEEAGNENQKELLACIIHVSTPRGQIHSKQKDQPMWIWEKTANIKENT